MLGVTTPAAHFAIAASYALKFWLQGNIRKKTKGAGGRSTALMGLLDDGGDHQVSMQ
jgi:hypothetical protein